MLVVVFCARLHCQLSRTNIDDHCKPKASETRYTERVIYASRPGRLPLSLFPQTVLKLKCFVLELFHIYW